MKNIIIHSYWRTGSNLSIKLLQKYTACIDLNEWYSFTIDSYYRKNKPRPEIPLTEINNYLTLLVKGNYEYLNTNQFFCKKCIFPQYKYLTPEIKNLFSTNILLHRNNISKTLISRYIADSRSSWSRTQDIEQPIFNDEINIDKFIKTYLNQSLTYYENFINNCCEQFDWVFLYEDLVKLTQIKNINFLPSHNINIQNIDIIENIFSESKVSKRIDNINNWFAEKYSSAPNIKIFLKNLNFSYDNY